MVKFILLQLHATSRQCGVATVIIMVMLVLISIEICTISAKMTENNSVGANCNVTVQPVPSNVREVRISPNVTELVARTNQNYNC